MVKSLPATITADVSSQLLDACEIFARGFAFTRSFTHPFLAERVGKMWVVRDGPRGGTKAQYRVEEWIAYNVDPAEVDVTARKHTRGRYALCVIRDRATPDGPIRQAYKSLGYRLGRTEAFMRHRLREIPKLPEPFPVQRILTSALADEVKKLCRGVGQILPEHLTEYAPLRLYAAFAADKPVGRLRSIVVGDSTWVSNVYVDPAYRRRGIGKAMLVKMLQDDRAHGAARSVLLASHTGAMLYPTVGYELIGQLLLYTPRKT